MSTLMFGKGFLINPGTWTAVPNGVAGYVTPIMRVPQIVEEESAISRLKNSVGIVVGIIDPNDTILKCTFTYLPAGSTIANATTSISLPTHGGYLITGLPVVQAGLFSDAFNTSGGGSTQPWFYFGGGEIVGAEEGKEWTGSITLYRFYSISSATPIT